MSSTFTTLSGASWYGYARFRPRSKRPGSSNVTACQSQRREISSVRDGYEDRWVGRGVGVARGVGFKQFKVPLKDDYEGALESWADRKAPSDEGGEGRIGEVVGSGATGSPGPGGGVFGGGIRVGPGLGSGASGFGSRGSGGVSGSGSGVGVGLGVGAGTGEGGSSGGSSPPAQRSSGIICSAAMSSCCTLVLLVSLLYCHLELLDILFASSNGANVPGRDYLE